MKLFLKIKIKSLAEEARIIKFHERIALRMCRRLRSGFDSRSPFKHNKKEKKPNLPAAKVDDQTIEWSAPHSLRWSQIRDHRLKVLRTESRASNLAYAFLRGKSYSFVEKVGAKKAPDWSKIESIAYRFNEGFSPPLNRPFKDTFNDWLIEAKAYFTENQIVK